MKNYKLPETVEITDIANAIKSNCVLSASPDTNYRGDREDPYLPMAIAMYWMQEFNYPKEVIQSELNCTDFAYDKISSYLNENLSYPFFTGKLRLVGNAFRIKSWEQDNQHQFDYFNRRLKIRGK